MSLIAGYQAKNGRVERAGLRAKLKSYRILAEDDPSTYDSLFVETQFGCLMRKYKPDYPVQRKPYDDGNGKALLILGFLYSEPAWLSARELEESEGEFVAMLSEPSGTVHIINDRFGSRPFYVLDHQDGVYFSSNLSFLLHLVGGSHETDVVGWFQMFGCGHTIGNRTTFRDVKRVPPAAHLTISSDGIVVEKRYWRLQYEPAANLDLLSHSTKVFEAFRAGAVLRARLTGQGVLALSGGLDSRLVAGALPDKAAHFPAFTFVNSGEAMSTADTRGAVEVCKVLGIEHHIEPIPRQDYSAVGEDVIRLTGGMRPFHHSATVMPYIRELKRRGLKFLFGGGPGDVSAGSKIPSVQYLDPLKTDRCLQDFYRSLAAGSDSLMLLFRPEIVASYSREYHRSLSESLADITGPTAAHRVTAWELKHRWPAFTFTSVLHNHPDASEAFCHLDYRYSDLMLQLPAEWLYQRNFYSCMIYHCLPELRQIPYANTGQLLTGQLQHFEKERGTRRLAALAANCARKVLPKAVKRQLRSKDTPSFSYLLYKGDERLFADIKECLHSQKALREILDIEKCLRFVDDFRADTVVDISYSGQTELMGGLTTMCQTFKVLMNS